MAGLHAPEQSPGLPTWSSATEETLRQLSSDATTWSSPISHCPIQSPLLPSSPGNECGFPSWAVRRANSGQATLTTSSPGCCVFQCGFTHWLSSSDCSHTVGQPPLNLDWGSSPKHMSSVRLVWGRPASPHLAPLLWAPIRASSYPRKCMK